MHIALLLVSVLALPSDALRLGHKSLTKESDQKTSDEACASGAKRKLIVNSHVDAQEPLDVLLASLKKHGFTKFEDIVVFRGGAKSDAAPANGQDGITLVDLGINSFDLNAFHGLSKYNDHPRVCADTYFYIHDTTSVGPCFPKVFDELNAEPEEIITPGRAYFSNQCVFGRGVAKNFGDAFDLPVSKKDGLKIENGGCFGKACAPATFAKNWTMVHGRRDLGRAEDLYTKGTRSVVWYQDLDLYKYISWEWNFNKEKEDNADFSLDDNTERFGASCARHITIPISEHNRLSPQEVDDQNTITSVVSHPV